MADQPPREEGIEHVYNDRVLVGNWYENRFSDHTDHHAITPCIYGQSSCTLGNSTQRTDYKRQIDPNSAADKNQFVQLRNCTFDNRLKATEEHIRFYDGAAFLKNMTTSKDIFYRLKVQDAKSDAAARSEGIMHHHGGGGDAGKFHTHDDMLRSYGNQTWTGLNLYLCLEQQKRVRYDVSTYQDVFTPKSVVVKRVLKGGGKKWMK